MWKLFTKYPEIEDSRGNVHRQFPAVQKIFHGPDERKLYKQWWKQNKSFRNKLLACYLLFLFIALVFLGIFYLLPLWAEWTLSALLFVPSLALGINFNRWMKKELSKFLLSRGRCHICGYSLVELIPKEDGCRVCPECGAAWRLEDFLQSTESPTG